MNAQPTRLFTTACLALVISLVMSVCIGQVSYFPWEIKTLLNDPMETQILFDLRLPRAVFAILVGLALSLSGVGTQGLFRNALADPYVLGISGGAAVGAALAIAFATTTPTLGIASSAFVGALSVSISLIVLTRSERWSNHAVLLIGIAINLLCGSILAVIMFSANEQTTNIVLWLMGNLGHVNWTQLLLVTAFIVVGATLLIPQAKHLDVHLFGEETAAALGSPLSVYRGKTILGVCLLVSAAVCFCGAIGFVGLVIPHAIRLLIGPRHLPLMCIAPIIGACFLLICDTVARIIISPQILPVGVVTGLVGGPIFIYLLFREQT